MVHRQVVAGGKGMSVCPSLLPRPKGRHRTVAGHTGGGSSGIGRRGGGKGLSILPKSAWKGGWGWGMPVGHTAWGGVWWQVRLACPSSPSIEGCPGVGMGRQGTQGVVAGGIEEGSMGREGGMKCSSLNAQIQ